MDFKNNLKANKPTTLRLSVFALLVALALPGFAFGQGRGRGHGKDKKQDVFINGHDARDGRYDDDDKRDKHRNKRDKHDRDRDDDDDNGRDRDRDRDDERNNGSIGRIAARNGYSEGLRAGQEDAARGEQRDFRDESVFQDATAGYRDSYGNIEAYRRSFREGFRRGYQDGFRRNNNTGGDRNDVRRVAASNGYQEGYRAGRDDRSRNDRRNYRNESIYRDATAGYRNEYGNIEAYRRYFREGFQRGYEDGYQNRDPRNNSGSGFGNILGNILGQRP